MKNAGSRLGKYVAENDLDQLKLEKMNIKLKLQNSFGAQQRPSKDLIRVEDLDPTPTLTKRNNIKILKTPADIINEQANKSMNVGIKARLIPNQRNIN